jgi:hypothetical protein
MFFEGIRLVVEVAEKVFLRETFRSGSTPVVVVV